MEAFMRIAAVSVLALLAAAGSAWAQSSYDYRDRDRGAESYGGSAYDSDRSSRRGWGRGDMDDDDHGKTGALKRGAVFHLKAGEREFRVRCAPDESTRECADAALMMFRQVQAATQTNTSPSSAGTTGTSITPGGATSGATGGGSATGR
jgi:hypothetical protein